METDFQHVHNISLTSLIIHRITEYLQMLIPVMCIFKHKYSVRSIHTKLPRHFYICCNMYLMVMIIYKVSYHRHTICTVKK